MPGWIAFSTLRYHSSFAASARSAAVSPAAISASLLTRAPWGVASNTICALADSTWRSFVASSAAIIFHERLRPTPPKAPFSKMGCSKGPSANPASRIFTVRQDAALPPRFVRNHLTNTIGRLAWYVMKQSLMRGDEDIIRHDGPLLRLIGAFVPIWASRFVGFSAAAN